MAVTILICDDEAPVRALVRASLAHQGYVLLEAADGNQSLELARAERPDLIVLDMMMPGRTGLEVLTELRNEAATAHARVLVVTARTQAGDRAAADAAGADAFLAKPFSPIELMRLVGELAEQPVLTHGSSAGGHSETGGAFGRRSQNLDPRPSTLS